MNNVSAIAVAIAVIVTVAVAVAVTVADSLCVSTDMKMKENCIFFDLAEYGRKLYAVAYVATYIRLFIYAL